MKVPASQCYLNSFTIDTVLRLAFTLNEKETKERIRRTLCGLLACFGVFVAEKTGYEERKRGSGRCLAPGPARRPIGELGGSLGSGGENG